MRIHPILVRTNIGVSDFLDHRYWIKDGIVYHAKVSHVDFICSNPELFGWTEEALRAVYAQCDEPFKSEGGARTLIVGKALRDGWVRVRRYNSFWEYSTLYPDKHLVIVRSFLSEVFKRPFFGYLDDSTPDKVHLRKDGHPSSILLQDFLEADSTRIEVSEWQA